LLQKCKKQKVVKDQKQYRIMKNPIIKKEIKMVIRVKELLKELNTNNKINQILVEEFNIGFPNSSIKSLRQNYFLN